jgi:hypothetical protein
MNRVSRGIVEYSVGRDQILFSVPSVSATFDAIRVRKQQRISVMSLGLFAIRKIISRRQYIDFTAVSESSQELKAVETAINGDASCRAAEGVFDGDDVHGWGSVVKLGELVTASKNAVACGSPFSE